MQRRVIGLVGLLCSLCCIKAHCQESNLGEEYLYRPKFFQFTLTQLPESRVAFRPENGLGTAPEQSEDNREISTKLRIPLKMSGKLKLVSELKYKNEFVSLRPSVETEDWERVDFRNAGISLFYDYQINDTYYLMGHLGANKQGDEIGQVQLDVAANYGASILLGKHTSEICRVGFGLKVGNNLGRFNVIPIFMYNRKMGNRVYLDLILPKQAQVRYAFSRKFFGFFSAEADGSNFAFTGLHGDEVLEYRRRQVDFKFGFEYEIHDWLWMGANVGYALPINSVIVNKGDRTRNQIHNFGTNGSTVANISLFMVPPRSLFAKLKNH